MDYKEIYASQIDLLWELKKQYKAEIGEDIPNDISKKRLKDAISKGEILFFGAWEVDALVGCCSITVGFSTFDYMPSGTFEDFFICPGGQPAGRFLADRRGNCQSRQRPGASSFGVYL